jgi:small subunit ribosomal protein S2
MVKASETNSADASLIERLYSAGAHYGFSKSRRHPTAMPYLFGNKQGTDIFDLEKTSALLVAARAYLKKLAAGGGQALFVGTKEEIKETVKAHAAEVSMPSVTNRWIGGTLTNFPQIQKRIAYLATLRAQQESGELERKYTKKEQLLLSREMEKLAFNFGGITAMEHLPAALLVVDPRHEVTAVREARQMRIPIIAVMSSDCNAGDATFPVFVNDAHRASVTLALDELVAGYKEREEAV